jgi:hypothetical protein
MIQIYLFLFLYHGVTPLCKPPFWENGQEYRQ